MSAIGIIYSRHGAPIDQQMLGNLATGIERLGPDGGNELAVGPIGIAYRAFHTTRESHDERQPIVSRLGNLLVMDGIIFNRDELIDLLRDDMQDDRTDAGLVSIGLDIFGVDFLARVIGNFALAWWQPETKTLTLARDPFGVRPLFYYYDEGRIIAGSDLKSVLDAVAIPLEIDDEYIAGFLAMFPEPKRTPYKRFHTVEPGMFVRVERDRMEIKRYWSPDVNKEIRYDTDEEYADHCRQLMFEGVKGCLRTDGRPVWASLSGGLDSSSIVCIANQLIKNGIADATQLGTYSLVYDQSETADERRFIRVVENRIGRTGYHLFEDEYWMRFQSLDNIFLCIPSTLYCAYGRSENLRNEMRKHNARVLIDGNGGDQVFWNDLDASPELADLLVRGRLTTLYHRLSVWSQTFKRRYLEVFLSDTIAPLLPDKIKTYLQSGVTKAEWFNQRFVKSTCFRERILPPPDTFKFHSYRKIIHARSILQASWLIAAGVYRRHETIEMRHPLFYRPLIDFMLSIPFEQILRPGETRSIMRRALKDILPTTILRRKGKGSIDEASIRGMLREWSNLTDIFSDARVYSRGYVDPKAFRLALNRALHGGRVHIAAMIKTMSLEIWLRSMERYTR